MSYAYSSYQQSSQHGGAQDNVNQIAQDLLTINNKAADFSFSGNASNGYSSGDVYSSGGEEYTSYGAGNAADSYSGFKLGNASASSAQSYDLSSVKANNLVVSSNNASLLRSNAIGSGNYVSEIEQQILRAQQPVQIAETEEITVNGERGVWANRGEVVNWRGVIPIEQYVINQDTNPEIITKRSAQSLEYIQELAIRYLRPPTPPAPGEIIIKQDVNTLIPPAPPLILRQQPARPSTPEPLVIREAPPPAPGQVGRKVVTISGKRIPPPPRKVIIERLAQIPSKPQSIIIERWLPYAQVKRRVVFQGAQQLDAVVVKPRNVIVQWEAPEVKVRREVKYLGVIRANPADYVQRYGSSLKLSRDLPQFVLDIKSPDGLTLAADYTYNNLHELEGDLQALKFVDLDREGLVEYRQYLQRLGISYQPGAVVGTGSSVSYGTSGAVSGQLGSSGGAFGDFVSSSGGSSSSNRAAIEQVFKSLNLDKDSRISREEAEKALLKLNSILGRSYGAADVSAFFQRLDTNVDGYLDFDEFKRAFQQQ